MEKLVAVERFIQASQGLTEEEARLKFETDTQYREDAEQTAVYIVETVGTALEKAVEAIYDLVKSLIDQIKPILESFATYAKQHPEAISLTKHHQEIEIPEIPVKSIGKSLIDGRCLNTPQSFTRGG